MNRSIFPIWKTLSFNSFLISSVFTLLICIFGFFHGGFVECEELIKIVYNNINIRYSPTISSIKLYNSIDFFQNYVLNTPNSQFKFSIYRYLQFNGSRFPYNSVFDHFHINFYINNIYNVHYGFPLTHNPKKLGLLPHEYIEFSEFDLKNNNTIQYILNNLHIYDMNLIKFKDYTNVYNKYIEVNNNICISQVKKLANVK